MTAFLADPVSKRHEPGPGHPESPARFDAVMKGLAEFNKLTCTGRTRAEMLDPGLGFLKPQAAESDGLQHVGTGAAAALGVGITVEKRPVQGFD